MADNIVGGLFGMTPELLQAQRNAQLEQQAANFVNNYGDQGAMFGYKLGNVLGRGIGGMLGAQDPEMMRIKQRQQMLQGLDMNDPQSLMKAAQEANQRGDTPAAQELYNKAQQVAQAQADIAKTQAETQKALREPSPFQRLLEKGDYTAESIKQAQISGDIADLVRVDKTKPVNYGDNAEIESRALFGVPFSSLTQTQAKQVADSLEAKGIKRSAAGAARFSPEINLTSKELDWRKQFLSENQPVIDQGANVRQSLNLLSQDNPSPFSTAVFKNTVVSAFGGDKQKSKSEIDRLVNTGTLDTRIANTVLGFFEGTVSTATVEDQRKVLSAVDKALKARYDNKAKDWTSRLNKAKVDPTMVVPSYEETVGVAPTVSS